MSEQHGKTYRPWEPQRYQQEVHSPQAKLPEGDLVFFLVDIVPQVDLSRFYAPYETETRGAPPFDPAMMVCLAGEAGLVKLGNVSTDGTKIQGNASRHKAMSYGYMQKEVERLREEIETLVTQASQQDEAEEAVLGSRRGDALPAELARREDRLATIEAARRRLEARAKAEADAERQRRAEVEAERARTGAPRRGKVPKPVDDAPADKAQTNFTDPELPIMQTNNKGWEYCGNAPISVDGACQIILACDVTDAANDTQQAEPVAQATLATLTQAGIALPQDEAGQAHAIPATLDTGYYSEAAAQALEA